MPRVDDTVLLAILVRHAVHTMGIELDFVPLKAALETALAESEVRVFMQTTRPEPTPYVISGTKP